MIPLSHSTDFVFTLGLRNLIMIIHVMVLVIITDLFLRRERHHLVVGGM